MMIVIRNVIVFASFVMLLSMCDAGRRQGVEPNHEYVPSDGLLLDVGKEADAGTDARMTSEPQPDLGQPIDERKRDDKGSSDASTIEADAPKKCSSNDVTCLPYRSYFSHIFDKCSTVDGQKECHLLGDMALSQSGLLLLSVTVVRYITESRTIRRSRTLLLDPNGKVLFSYDHGAPMNSSYFIILDDEGAYIEFAASIAHKGRFIRISIRSLKTGQLLPMKGTVLVPYTRHRAAYDKYQKHLIYVEGNDLVAYLPGNRNPIWRQSFSSPVQCAPAIDRNSQIYTCLEDGTIVAVSGRGKKVWEHQTWKSDFVQSTVVVSQDRVIAKHLGGVSAYKMDGTLLWKRDRTLHSEPVITPTNQIWWSSDGYLSLYDGLGKPLLERLFVNANYLVFSPTILENRQLLFFSSSGEFVQLHPNDKKLEKVKIPGVSVGDRAYGHFFPDTHNIVIGKDRLLVRAYKGNQIGILSVFLPTSPLAKKGWPVAHANFANTRQAE